MGAFETAHLLDGRAVELVMITITPPSTVTKGCIYDSPEAIPPPQNATMMAAHPQRAWNPGDKPGSQYKMWAKPFETWREAYIWLFSKMRKTTWWQELGVLGGIWAFEDKQRQPGEWISCARPCCRKQNPPGVKCPNNGYGRYAGDDETHPHLHIVAQKLTGDRWPTARECARRITKYTKANGFGYGRVDKRHGDLKPTVAYATKYVTKDTGGGGRTKGVFGYLTGKITSNDSTRKALRRYE